MPLQLLEDLWTGVFAFDDQGALLFANTAARRVLGETNVIDKLGRATFDDLSTRDATLAQLAAEGTILNFEIRRRTWQGQPAWVALEQSRTAARDALHRAIFEHSLDGIFLADSRGFYVEVNSAGLKLLGREREEVIGHHLTEFVAPDDLEARPPGYHALEVGKPFSIERRMVRKDGSVFTASITSSRLPGGWIQGVVRDLTLTRTSEELLRQATKMDAIGRLSGGVAHDFNNLLTVVGSLATVLEGEVTSRGGRELLGELHEVVARGSALTRQLLTFAKRGDAEPRVIDVASAVTRFSKLLTRVLSDSIRFDLDLSGDPLSIRIDPVHFEQVLLNLAVNARDSMPEGGMLRISTARDQDRVVIRVQDTGAGMTAETRARVFEPFFTTKAGRGTGLGLATTHSIVLEAGGTISVDSSIGRGTTFLLSFACCEPVATMTPAPRSAAPGHPEGAAIVLVEDDPNVRHGLLQALLALGHSVQATGDAVEALALLRSKVRVDLLVTDVGLRDLDGGRLAQEVRKVRPELKILFVSGYPTESLDSLGRVLAKPFAAGEFGAAVADALAASIRPK